MGLIRLFLALVVAIDHLRAIVLNGTPADPAPYIARLELGLNAGYAVFYFYVLSGFLISYALSRKYASGRIYDYLKSRGVRIFSLYWPVFLIGIWLDGGMPSGIWHQLSGIFLFGSDWIASFGQYPDQDFSPFSPYFNQAWSLGAELTFYVLMPLLIRSTAGCVALAALSLAVRLALVRTLGFTATWSFHFFPTAFWLFMIGHLSRVCWHRWQPPAWLGVALLAASAAISLRYNQWDTGAWYAAIFLFAASLPGVFALTKDNRAMNLAGDLSYPLYLTHKAMICCVFWWTPIGAVLLRHGSAASLGAFVCIAVAMAWLAFVGIEKPVARLMRAALSTAERLSTPRVGDADVAGTL